METKVTHLGKNNQRNEGKLKVRNWKPNKKNNFYIIFFLDESDSSENDDSDVEEITPGGIDQELKLEIFDIFEERKRFLLRKTSTFLGSSKNSDFKTYIDNDNAQLIVQYLASKRSFTQSFDKYLQKIILAVR